MRSLSLWSSFDRLRLGTKLNLVLGAACLLCMTLIVVLQTWHHFDRAESERRRANERITESIAAPLSTVLPVEDEAALFGFMEMLDNDQLAAGLVIVKGTAIVKSQQSLRYAAFPDVKLAQLALQAASLNGVTVTDEGDFQLVAVPIKDSAQRVIGSLAVAWDTSNLLARAWRELIVLLVWTVLACGFLMLLMRRLIRGWVTRPLAVLAGSIQQGNGAADSPDTTRRYQARGDEIGALARSLHVAHETEQRIRVLSALTSDGVVLHRNGIITDLNPSAERLLQLVGKPAVGMKLGDLTQCGSLGDLTGGDAVRVLTLCSGEKLSVEISSSTTMMGDDTVDVLALRDVTALSRALIERERAQAASDAKSRFLAVMSHEMRTPLNGIIGMTEILKKTELSDKQRKLVDPILRSGRNLLTIVSDVLDLSRIEAGKIELHEAAFDLRDSLNAIIALFAEDAREKGLALGLRLSDDVPAAVFGDENRLRQIIVNLVGNAMKFTPQGSVTLEVGVSGRHDDRVEITFTCVDTGIGIAPDAVDRLFLPFSQADASISRRFGGTGLGLSISRHFVELMGGRIEVAARQQAGTRISFTVPLRRAEEKQHVPAIAPARADSPAGTTRPQAHVLVAEDNPVNLEVMCWRLEDLGLTYKTANNGREAVEAYGAASFDIVLMDTQMPEIDGLSATRLIRQRELASGARRVPIIAVTANAFEADRQEALEAGSDDFLSKPFEEQDLVAKLARWLHDGSALRRRAA